jgi:glutamate synthase domain-containing protein 2
MRLAFSRRYSLLTVVTLASLVLLLLVPFVPWALAPLVVTLTLSVIGFHDFFQRRHSILRSYPIAAHFRFLFEEIRPEIRQYFLESDTDGTPFSRDKRAIVYQRAKGDLDKRPFGTQRDVYEPGFEWLSHSLFPTAPSKIPFRVHVGGPECTQPYDLSVLNISAMSFGALSANAIRALNKGAKMGGFAHDTGEGSVSIYHKEYGGDLIWELGSGYFGCRNNDGTFSPEKFAAQAADPQIKMIEIKLSQGAKPGHGGVLPGPKVSAEIARARGVEIGVDCVSPPRHSAFTTPREMMQFIRELRNLSNGKPIGFKLCIGHPWEFLAICKAMLETEIYPDFIVVDGAEGGTGAAPLEFLDHIGMPLRDGLIFVHNSLVGIGARDRIQIGAAGKITSAFDMARVMALGADWCNAARGFMFAVGCIQAQSCHTDRCPTGVATQDPVRQRALVVPQKAERVRQFHAATVKALAEVIAAAGLEHPRDLRPEHISKRINNEDVKTYAELHTWIRHGDLLLGARDPAFRHAWAIATADSFIPLSQDDRRAS